MYKITFDSLCIVAKKILYF